MNDYLLGAAAYAQQNGSRFLDWLFPTRKACYQMAWRHAEMDVKRLKERFDMAADAGGLVYMATYLGDEVEVEYDHSDVALAMNTPSYLRGYLDACAFLFEGEPGIFSILEMSDYSDGAQDSQKEWHIAYFDEVLIHVDSKGHAAAERA